MADIPSTNTFLPGGFIAVVDRVTESEILACVTAVCSMPESAVKIEILRQLVPILERLNHPLMSIGDCQ